MYVLDLETNERRPVRTLTQAMQQGFKAFQIWYGCWLVLQVGA